MNMFRIISIVSILCISLSGVSQGIVDGFLNAPETKNLALSASIEQADTYYLWNEDLELPITSSSLSVFYKQQFTKHLGAAINLPLVNLKPQDGTVFVTYGASKALGKQLQLTGILGLGATHPLSDYGTESATSVGQQTKSVNVRAVAQLAIKNKFFISPRYGVNFVKDPTPSVDIGSVKIGYYKNKWYTDAWIEQQVSRGGRDYRGIGDQKADNFRQLGVNYTRIGGVVYHQTKEKLGLFLGWAYTLDGRNTYKTTRISTGIVLKL